MTDTTDIKALSNERLLEIKSILSGFEDGYDTVDDKENYEAMRGAQLLIDELISLRDQLEAERQRVAELEEHSKKLYEGFHQERQRADDAVTERNTALKQASAARNGFDEQYTLREKAEAELAALKGDQVPVVSELIPEGMKYSSALPEFVGDSNEISSYRCWIHGNTRKVATQEQAYADAKSVCELFTVQQKPVVLPQAHKVRAGVTLTGDERNVMIPCDDGNWLSRLDVEHSIKMAGGIVKDGE